MDNELEKQFFDTFGIEPYDRYLNCTENLEGECKKNCNCCDKAEDVYCYPTITDRTLLELICILLSNNSPYMFKLGDWDVEKLKDTVLAMCIKLPDFLEWENTSEYFKHQVYTLFEEG